MATSATIGPAIRTNVQGDKVKWRCRLIGVSDAFLALSMMLRWVQLKWKSGMAVASPRLSSLSLFLFLFASLPVFLLPCIHPSFSSYSSSFFLIPNSTHTQSHAIYMYTYTHMKWVLCFRSLYVPSFDSSSSFPSRLVSSSLLSVPLASARGLPYVCPDLKIVRLVPGRGVPNELEIRSQPRTRER